MSNLRAELRGETLPAWTIAVPDGWVRHTPDAATRDRLVAQARSRLMSVHRPDVFAELRHATEQAFEQMRRLETVAFFAPGRDAPDSAYLPVSLTAAVLRGRDGASLDEEIAHLIRSEGATALGADRRFLRWRSDGRTRLGGSSVATTSVVYLTPVPATGRRRALQFTLLIAHDPGAVGDGEYVDELAAFFDAHLSTFRWIDK